MLREVNTESFTYTAATRTFVAEASDFGSQGMMELFKPLEPKGCGFVLVSGKTGRKVVMRLVRTKKVKSDWCEDGPDDVVSWVFEPHSQRGVGADFSVELLND